MVVAGKGGVQLPTVIARGRTRGQFGIWQSPCPRLLDPIRQPALWFQKQTWKIYSWAYPINCAECQPQLYRSFVINISAINRRIPHATVPGQGGHLGPVFIWIQSQQNNNISTSHHVVNNSDEDSSEPTHPFSLTLTLFWEQFTEHIICLIHTTFLIEWRRIKLKQDASRYHRRSMWLMIILHWISCFFSKAKITFLIILKINWLHCWEGWQWRNECKALIDPLHTTEMMMMIMMLMILLFGFKIIRKTLSERSCYSASYAVGPLIVAVRIMGSYYRSCTYCHGLWDASPIVAWEFKKD